MVQRKIRWSHNALNDKLSILEYWYKKNGNAKYSRQLDKQFRNITTLLKRHDKIGKFMPKTNQRFIVKDYYQIFYRLNEDYVEILHIWDSRQNPDKVSLK